MGACPRADETQSARPRGAASGGEWDAALYRTSIIFEFVYSGGIEMFAHNAGNFESKAQGIL